MGLDLCIPFRLEWYNLAVEPQLKLENFGNDGHLGFLLGNTGKLWPLFQQWLAQQQDRIHLAHPLDAYMEQHLEAFRCSRSEPLSIRYAHDVSHAPFAAQRLAQSIGLTWTSPAQLSIHPSYGPWLSFRAVVSTSILAADSLPLSPTPAPACDACARACLPAYTRVCATLQNLEATTASAKIRNSWQDWVAVRVACPRGASHRFSATQLQYHYTHDKDCLLRVDC